MVGTDRQALKALGLNEREAAEILGRKRQAINTAIGKHSDRAGYFTVSELMALCLAAKGRGHKVDERSLAAYVQEQVGAEKGAEAGLQASQDFLTGFGAFGAPVLSAFDEVWVILPDFLRIRRGMADRANELRDIMGVNSLRRIVYMCGSPIHRDTLGAFLGFPDNGERVKGDGRVVVLADSLIAAQLTMLIGNPLSEGPQVFVLTKAGFLSVPYVDASLLAEYLSQRVDRLADLPPPPNIQDEEEKQIA